MFCKFCSQEIRDNAEFCPYCGNENKVEAQSVTPPVQPQSPAPQQYYQPVQQSFAQPPLPQVKKKSNLPIIIVAIVLIAAVVAGAIFLTGILKKDKNGENGEGSAEPPKPVAIRCITDIDIEAAMGMEMGMKIEYTDSGFPSKIYIDADGENTESKTEYNEENYTYKSFTYENGALVEESVAECNDMWEEIKVTNYENGVETSYTLYEYNEAGKRTKETVCEGGVEKESTVYEYDANNNITKETAYEDGSVSKTVVYTYDANGLLINKKVDFDYGDSFETVYTYDANGLCSKAVYYENNSEEGYDVFNYDENGELKSRDTYMMGMKVITTTVTYTTFEVSAKYAESLEDSQAELIGVINFFEPQD